jgi:DNA (cytosine-5)-methyltransferase 1
VTLTVGSLFSGIGGFDLGLERAGMRTVWFCEQDPFCQRVLAKHWPGVPCHSDVRALVADTECAGLEGLGRGSDGAGSTNGGGAGPLPVPVPYVDVLCGGFPCQDLSYAGAGAGIDGERSGLWSEYARLIRELRPRYVVVENVSALLARGLGRVLGDLAACGYDAEWDCIPASAVGAPHRRDRTWLVAYPQQPRLEGLGCDPGSQEVPEPRDGRALADSSRDLQAGSAPTWTERDRTGARCERGRAGEHWWSVEPDVGRVAHGVSARVDRLRSLGNALVPQIAEWLGHRIMVHEGL